MKLLLDENLPHRLRHLLVGHDVFTVTFMQWNGIENGSLLALAGTNGFDAVITKDIGLSYQQNLSKLPCSLIIIEAKSNELEDIAPLVPDMLRQLVSLQSHSVIYIR